MSIYTQLHISVGTGFSGHRSTGQRFWPGRVRSQVSVTDPVSDRVLVVCFSAGKITRKDRARLHGDTVEATQCSK